MNDDFLHRLRKDPPPGFAARLRAQLRLQLTPSPRPRAPSLLRNLVTVLLLGGTAFAVTSLVISGLPVSLLKWYQHTAARIVAGHAPAPDHRARRYGTRAVRPWSPAGLGSADSSTPQGRPGHSATPATNPSLPAAASGAPSGSSSRIFGAAPGGQRAQVVVATSWAAYPYVEPIAEIANRSWPAEIADRNWSAAGRAGGRHIDVSVQDSAPGSMCGGGARAPDLAYIFGPAGTVPNPPCPRSASGNPTSIVALPAGYEAVALARSPLYGAVNLTRREVFLALAKWIPDPRAHTVHENSNTTWRELDAALGAEPIAFLGPPLSSAAGRSLIELLLEGGCQTFPWVAALKSTDPDRYARICRTVRTDGVYAEVSSLAPSRLLSEPNAVGIFAYRDLTYAPFKDLAVGTLDGVEPTLSGIASGAYPGSCALYLYVNRARAPVRVVMTLLRDEEWIATRPDSALLPLSSPDVRSALEALAR